ncbi:hypothetical protein AB1Y20_015379 [Prymnesium parvum]|uniref:Uncharacterized protein n=1 Tax=Prymnesium parvum TaxID=97485 RepID=A0AB34K0P7_PRYPA
MRSCARDADEESAVSLHGPTKHLHGFAAGASHAAKHCGAAAANAVADEDADVSLLGLPDPMPDHWGMLHHLHDDSLMQDGTSLLGLPSLPEDVSLLGLPPVNENEILEDRSDVKVYHGFTRIKVIKKNPPVGSTKNTRVRSYGSPGQQRCLSIASRACARLSSLTSVTAHVSIKGCIRSIARMMLYFLLGFVCIGCILLVWFIGLVATHVQVKLELVGYHDGDDSDAGSGLD